MRWLCRGSVFSSFRAVGVELTAAIYSRWKSSIRHRWMWKDFRLVIKGPRSAWNYFGLFERIHHSMSIRIYLIWGWLHMSVHHHCPPPHEIASGAWSSLSSEVVGEMHERKWFMSSCNNSILAKTITRRKPKKKKLKLITFAFIVALNFWFESHITWIIWNLS